MFKSVNVLGAAVSDVTIDETLQAVWQFVESGQTNVIYTPNPEIIYYGYKNPEYMKILNTADLTLPDGIGVVYGARILKTPLRGRVAGFDVCCRILGESVSRGASVYIMGGKPGVAEMARSNAERDYPGVKITGVHDGYFSDDDEVIQDINEKNPDILFVCLSFPRQEEWIFRNRNKLSARVIIGCGGTVDALAGTVRRAPDFFIKLNLEWFYRLIKQPSRFVRMLSLPKFLFAVMFAKGKKYE